MLINCLLCNKIFIEGNVTLHPMYAIQRLKIFYLIAAFEPN